MKVEQGNERERKEKRRDQREKGPGCVDLTVSAKPVLNVDGRDVLILYSVCVVCPLLWSFIIVID